MTRWSSRTSCVDTEGDRYLPINRGVRPLPRPSGQGRASLASTSGRLSGEAGPVGAAKLLGSSREVVLVDRGQISRVEDAVVDEPILFVHPPHVRMLLACSCDDARVLDHQMLEEPHVLGSGVNDLRPSRQVGRIGDISWFLFIHQDRVNQ